VERRIRRHGRHQRLNGDGKAEILAAPPGTNGVSAFGTGGGNPFRTYQTFGGEAAAGAMMAAGDVVGDARPELVAAANTTSGIDVSGTPYGSLIVPFPPDGRGVQVGVAKRYASRGTYKITVTLADNHYRVSIAQSRALVRAK
jgi:hypothetical protein